MYIFTTHSTYSAIYTPNKPLPALIYYIKCIVDVPSIYVRGREREREHKSALCYNAVCIVNVELNVWRTPFFSRSLHSRFSRLFRRMKSVSVFLESHCTREVKGRRGRGMGVSRTKLRERVKQVKWEEAFYSGWEKWLVRV